MGTIAAQGKTIGYDAALVATTTAWALWLYHHKEFEPDFTWAQVVAGVALCWSHAHAQGAGDWRQHSWRVMRSFAIGGVPIIVGEVVQWLQLRAERQKIAKL